jgi:hypothetical protein
MDPMPVNSNVAGPSEALATSADELLGAAGALRDHCCSADAIGALPDSLARVRETLDLLTVSLQRMAHAVADRGCENGRRADDDSAAPEARALRWHLHTSAAALRDASRACAASGEWSRRMLEREDDRAG